MGQIKNIKLHIVTDIKAQLSLELTYHPPDGNGSLPYDERPYPPDDEDEVPVRTELAELRAAVEHITKIATVNRTEISSLKNKNDDLQKSNAALQAEITLLKVHAKECADHRRQPAPPPQQPHVQIPNDDLENLRTKVAEMEVELNSIQQYLRVNNLEIVGLPAPNDGESEESLLIHALNDLEGLTNRVTPQDIDISHPLPSK